MWDAQTFKIELWIEDDVFAEIGLQQGTIFRLENVERQRVIAFFNRVNDFFKLGKHRLPKERASNVVDLPIDQVGAHFWIACLLEQMMGEQLFVKSRGDLGEKDRVIVILKSLRTLGEKSVHRMARLVGQMPLAHAQSLRRM